MDEVDVQVPMRDDHYRLMQPVKRVRLQAQFVQQNQRNA